jgi:hypothetical protein
VGIWKVGYIRAIFWGNFLDRDFDWIKNNYFYTKFVLLITSGGIFIIKKNIFCNQLKKITGHFELKLERTRVA